MSAVLNHTLGVIYDDHRYKYMIYELLKLGYLINVLGAPELQSHENLIILNNGEELPDKLTAVILPVRGLEGDYSGISRWSNKKWCFKADYWDKNEESSKYISVIQKQKINMQSILLNNDEVYANKNAVLTAEGSIAALMEVSEQSLRGTCSYVLGYGRCGKALARLLEGFNVNVTVVARRAASCSEAWRDGFRVIDYFSFAKEIQRADSIFNTVPALILCECVLRKMSKKTIIIDIASKPGGTDFEIADQLGIRAMLLPGIPGKYAPETAGKIMAECIHNLI